MTSIGVRELSHHTSRYLAQVKAGKSLTITEHGRVIAVLSPAGDDAGAGRPRLRIGGHRSGRPLSADEIDHQLEAGFGDDSRR